MATTSDIGKTSPDMAKTSTARRRTLDAATVLMAFGPKAGAEALHHAFISEIASDTDAAQFWIEVYRVIVERRG
jgi:hypothetical protein